MGVGSSKQEDSSSPKKPETMEIVIDQGVKQQIDNLTKYVSMFNSNDAKSLLNIVKDYKIQLETQTGQSYQLDNAEKFISQFHQKLLDNIAKENTSLNTEERNQELAKTLSNTTKLPTYLKSMYDTNFAELEKKFNESPIIKNDKEMQNNIGSLLKDISDLKSKYKFFEYRYIQLNLFLIVFVQHTFKTMDNFINTVLEFTEIRDKQRQDSLGDLVKLLLDIMRQAELNIEPKDFENLDRLMSAAQKQVADKQKLLEENIKKAKVEAVTSLTNQLNTMEGVTGSSSQSQIPELLPQQGGFIRDHSTFPQSFYELCNKV